MIVEHRLGSQVPKLECRELGYDPLEGGIRTSPGLPWDEIHADGPDAVGPCPFRYARHAELVSMSLSVNEEGCRYGAVQVEPALSP